MGPYLPGKPSGVKLYGVYTSPRRIWVNWVNFDNPQSHGAHGGFGLVSRHIPWLLLVPQNPKARPWRCLAPLGDGDGVWRWRLSQFGVFLRKETWWYEHYSMTMIINDPCLMKVQDSLPLSNKSRRMAHTNLMVEKTASPQLQSQTPPLDYKDPLYIM